MTALFSLLLLCQLSSAAPSAPSRSEAYVLRKEIEQFIRIEQKSRVPTDEQVRQLTEEINAQKKDLKEELFELQAVRGVYESSARFWKNLIFEPYSDPEWLRYYRAKYRKVCCGPLEVNPRFSTPPNPIDD